MTTSSTYRYRINGAISTDRTVMQNMEVLASAAGSWVSYDINEGRWCVVINQPGSSIASFTDSNIIGGIKIGGTGLTDLYNSVKIEFPHIDLRDQKDYITIAIPNSDRNDNEPDNVLNLQYDIINDPVKVENLGFLELKQSRIDQIIQFTTDFSKFGLKAGDLIDVTSDVYGLTNQMYRIINIDESDGDDGSLNLSITGLQYDANVYINDLSRYTRNYSTGIGTIGNIGIPGTPTVSTISASSRPRVLIETTAPTGTVEKIEYWITNDVPPDVVNDSNRTYKLLGTLTSATGSNTFAYGESVVLDIDTLNTQNFLIKTRGINSFTTGPFSEPSGSIYYAPKQVTDQITNTTGVVDGSGNNMLAALALTTLLNNLDKLFRSDGSAQTNNGIFDTIFKVFHTDTGYDFRNDTTNVQKASSAAATGGMMLSAAAETYTVSGLGQTGASTYVQMGHTTTFYSPYSGSHKCDVIIDQNESGAIGGRGSAFSEARDTIAVSFQISDHSTGTIIADSTSGGRGAIFWQDFALTALFDLTANVLYDIKFFYIQNTESNPTYSTASFDISYNVMTIAW